MEKKSHNGGTRSRENSQDRSRSRSKQRRQHHHKRNKQKSWNNNQRCCCQIQSEKNTGRTRKIDGGRIVSRQLARRHSKTTLRCCTDGTRKSPAKQDQCKQTPAVSRRASACFSRDSSHSLQGCQNFWHGDELCDSGQ